MNLKVSWTFSWVIERKGSGDLPPTSLLLLFFDPHTNSIEFNGFDTGIEQRWVNLFPWVDGACAGDSQSAVTRAASASTENWGGAWNQSHPRTTGWKLRSERSQALQRVPLLAQVGGQPAVQPHHCSSGVEWDVAPWPEETWALVLASCQLCDPGFSVSLSWIIEWGVRVLWLSSK